MKAPDPIRLELYRHRFEGIADEMGSALQRTAYSPNIKERLDFSCAVFDARGRMVAQAAHIPVHLGAMPASVRAALETVDHWADGDVVVLNDPFSGGTHLPDVTMISPVFESGGELQFFVASRAHHADVGGMSPGSLPLSIEIYQEGLIIPPVHLVSGHDLNRDLVEIFLRNVRTPEERRGDLFAQLAAQQLGKRRLFDLVSRFGHEEVAAYAAALQDYSEHRMRTQISEWPCGEGRFEDTLEAPDAHADEASIRVRAVVEDNGVTLDFEGTSPAGAHSFNAVLPITESACYYAVRCLSSDDIPVNDGCFRPVAVSAPAGSLVNAQPPAAVAAGNVETSQRIVDAVFGALAPLLPDRVPAASQGTMNNIIFGSVSGRMEPFVYYETIAGGAGATPAADGSSAIHVHMTNTMNTPIEAFERTLPVRIIRYGVRRDSGGDGLYGGGNGVVREFEFLEPVRVTVQSTRRSSAPWGLAGGAPGLPGRNILTDVDGTETELPGRFSITVRPGQRLRIETPGGGGWGSPPK